jgi:hypothetical protein
MIKIEDHEREFDFWIGSWNINQRVLQANQQWSDFKAQTIVRTILDGHALMENWEGEVKLPWDNMSEPEYRKAISIRAYDPKAQIWNIYWLDTHNRYFLPVSTGNFKDGKGEFFSSLGSPGHELKGRITFSNITTNSVDWDFAILMGNDWKTM